VVKCDTAKGCTVGWAIVGVPLPAGRRIGGDGRIIIRPVVSQYGPRLLILSKSCLEVLVGDVDLLLQRVELGVLEDFPPFGRQLLVARLCRLPVSHLFVGGRSLYRRPVVLRSNRASNELKHCDCQENLQPDRLSGILLHIHFSKLLHLESPGNVARTIWTSCPETMESGGL